MKWVKLVLDIALAVVSLYAIIYILKNEGMRSEQIARAEEGCNTMSRVQKEALTVYKLAQALKYTMEDLLDI